MTDLCDKSMIDVFLTIKSIVVYASLLAMGGLVFGCLLLQLSQLAATSFRDSRAKDVVQRPFRRIVFLAAVAIACLYGGAKNESQNETGAGLRGSSSPTASLPGDMAEEQDDAAMAFTSFGVNSNVLAFSLSWTTNCMLAKSWIELYERISSLTNPWMPRLVREVAVGATNDCFSIVLTNGVPQASFYAARMDGITVDFPDLEATTGADGSRVFTSFGRTSFNVAVARPERSSSFPPPNPDFAANPFHGVDGASFDTQSSTLTISGYGTYDLPDGSMLVALGNPVTKFGSPHTYSGTSVDYDSLTGEYSTRSAYPLDSPALQRNWAQGQTPGTGCSCFPSVDFGNGLVVSDTSSTAFRAGGPALPPGMWTDFEYEDGGVWITLYNVTNVVWRKWQGHRHYPDNGGTSDELSGPGEEDVCGCGDVDSTEGASMGSVRFRIPLGSPSEGIFSGFLYFDRSTPFTVRLSSFELLRRSDALVTDVTDGMVRTVTCFDNRGRRIVLSEMQGGVTIEVRDRASGELQHTWHLTNEGSAIRMVKYSVLWNVMSDETYECEAGNWIRRDNVSGLYERRNMLKTLGDDGYNREEKITVCAGKTAIHTITDSELIGTGASAVLRETVRREKGADDVWKVSTASYWDDPAHPRRHGSIRLESGDDRAWCYRAYDDAGRVVFRLDQREGSPVPPDSPDYSIANLPSSSAAFATTYDYAPLAGDACKSNDCDKVRGETKYVVDRGAPILIGKTWKTYRRGTSDGYPTVVVTTERAASQTAVPGDAANAVSVESRFDDESAAVPYVLRGELASLIDEDGVETRYERSDAHGVLRTVERKFFNGNERKTRRVTEKDWNYGNLLYEAEAIAADGTEFGWARHAYDEKNRLRFTQYDDGSWETNAYSCCRLLWTIDRTGTRHDRIAETGTDHLHWDDVTASVCDLPKDPRYADAAWSTYERANQCCPVTRHYADGLGRETNAVICSVRRSSTGAYTFPTTYGYVHPSVTTYPQGVSDVSENLSVHGLRTRTVRYSRPDADVSVVCEYRPESVEPDAVMTNVEVRGGASVSWVAHSGVWKRRESSTSYGTDGLPSSQEIAETSDGGMMTDALVSRDFLGREICRTEPLSSRSLTYEGSTSRITGAYDGNSGVTSSWIYDECGEKIGEESCGVRSVSVADYARISGEWWRVDRTVLSAGSRTNSVEETLTRLTGLSDSVRRQIVRRRNGVTLSTETTSYNSAANTERTDRSSLENGNTWTVSKFGCPIEEGTSAGVTLNYYGPVGKVFSRRRTMPNGTQGCLDYAYVNGLGDVWAYERTCAGGNVDSPLVFYAYDCRGNRSVTTNEVGDAVERHFDRNGNLLGEDGDAYPLEQEYDAKGRRVGLATTRDGDLRDWTRWTYDGATGCCTRKAFADESCVDYTYEPDGLPLRTTNPDGGWTENVYDESRRLVGIASSDDSCAAEFQNDCFGRLVAATSAVGSNQYSLSSEGVATNEIAIVGDAAAVLRRTLDPCGRLLRLDVTGSEPSSVQYRSDGKVASVSNGECVVRYLYDTVAEDQGYVLTLTNGVSFSRALARHNYLREEILSVVNACGGDTNRYDYAYDDLRRPVARNADTFAYNRRGEVASATVAGRSAVYDYDFIGNFTSVAEGDAVTAYGANALNQYETVAGPDATFEPTYTPNGELASFGPWTYAYDALSRLTEVHSNGVLVASNFYDHQGRRVRLVTQNATHTFLYDGWNVVLELVEHDGVTDRIEYYWGKDISGSLQGAGGVGGLLYLKFNGAIYVPFYDAYGNVMEYRAADCSLAASYVYDAFGRTISQTGPLADAFRFRHATKCFDVETCLYYYGYRFYSVIVRRWLTRDPKAEMASHNLYLFDSNNPNVCYDLLGMYILSYHNFGDPPHSGWGPQTDAFFSAKFKVPFARQINYAGGKIGYKVEFKPKESLFEIYLRKSFTFNAINDELDHLRCALLYEYGLDQFKIAVEKIHECPDVAARKYEDAETELGRAQDECEKCNNALDRKGGPHGH